MKRNEFFLKIWKKLKVKRCWECGAYLGKEPLSYMFDHALEKNANKRPDLEFEEGNIFICCLECHTKKSNGFPGKKHQEFIKKVQKKYAKNK